MRRHEVAGKSQDGHDDVIGNGHGVRADDFCGGDAAVCLDRDFWIDVVISLQEANFGIAESEWQLDRAVNQLGSAFAVPAKKVRSIGTLRFRGNLHSPLF
jgi:hypothetical protein